MGGIEGGDPLEVVSSQEDLGIDGYEGFVPVGQGGFGSVYRCRQIAFHRTVAIKVLATSAPDRGVSKRFDRECRAVGALSDHPNILTVHDSGVSRWGRPFIVMDYMSGGSLADRIHRTGPIPWQEAVDMGIKIAGAVAAAHAEGILHRDIKPQNILISPYGEPKLADFGISTIPSGYQTHSGVITASVAHAPPEVLNGERATQQSDVYSLASTIYSIIKGSPPFVLDGDEQVGVLIARTLTQRVPDLRPTAPASVCRVLERGLEKHPNDRHGSAIELAKALQAAQRAEGVDLSTALIRPLDGFESAEPSVPTSESTATRPRARTVSAEPGDGTPEVAAVPRPGPQAASEVPQPPPPPSVPRRRRVLVGFVGGCLLLGGSGAALAFRTDDGDRDRPESGLARPTPRVESSQEKPVPVKALTIHFNRKDGSFGGRLRSPVGACTGGRVVKLKKRTENGPRVVGSDKTNDSGEWSIDSPSDAGRFFVTTPREAASGRDLICQSKSSRRLTVHEPKQRKKDKGSSPAGDPADPDPDSADETSQDASISGGDPPAGEGGGGDTGGSGGGGSPGSNGGKDTDPPSDEEPDPSPPPDAGDPSPGG